MRIEDLDPPRVVQGSAEAILAAYRWLGLDWDEGPFYQSDRDALYKEAFDTLLAQKVLYPCTCSRKEVAQITSAPHGELGPVYPGTCRQSVSNSDRDPAYRFKMPEESPGFVDRVASAVEAGRTPGDFVVRRVDGLWSYQFAVVIDDAEQRITEVVRGDDLLISTPRQIAIFHALGSDVPSFAHVSLVIDENGERLASRHKAASIEDYKNAGWNAEQLIGMLAYSLGYTKVMQPMKVEQVLASVRGDEIVDRMRTFPAPSEIPGTLK